MTSSINLHVGSPRVWRFPLYRSVQDSPLCVHAGCKLSTHSLGCGQHSASFLAFLQLSSCSTLAHSCTPVCVDLVQLRGVCPSSVPTPEVLCFSVGSLYSQYTAGSPGNAGNRNVVFLLIMVWYPNLFTWLFASGYPWQFHNFVLS